MNRSFLLLLCSVGLLSACAQHSSVSTPKKISDALKLQTGASGRACVRISDIRGYAYNNGVVSIDGGRRYYLATTIMRCHNLDTVTAVAFDGPGGEICGGGASRIKAADSECVVSGVFEFDNRSAAFSALESAKAMLEPVAAE